MAVLPDSVIPLEVLQVLVGGQNALTILDVFQELPNISIHEGSRVFQIPRILIVVINRAEGGLILGDRLEEGTTLIRATHQLQYFGQSRHAMIQLVNRLLVVNLDRTLVHKVLMP